jgi:hypothetical protein
MNALRDVGCTKVTTGDQEFNDKVTRLREYFSSHDMDVLTEKGRKEVGSLTNMVLHQGRCLDENRKFIFSKIFTLFKMILVGIIGVTMSGTYFHKFNKESFSKKLSIIISLGVISLFAVILSIRSLHGHNYNFLTNEMFFLVIFILIPLVFSSIYFMYLGNKRTEKNIKLLENIKEHTEKLLLFIIAASVCLKVEMGGQVVKQTIYGSSVGFYESFSYDDIIFISILCYYVMFDVLNKTKLTEKYSFEILLFLVIFFMVYAEIRRSRK